MSLNIWSFNEQMRRIKAGLKGPASSLLPQSKFATCPKCGYPRCHDGRNYKGIYVHGKPCDKCKFVEEVKK